jgi:acetyltransferase-like isoleucine patch superfamily enzyme
MIEIKVVDGDVLAQLIRQANDPGTAPRLLDQLSSSDDEVVRVAVALNKSTSLRTLESLSADRSDYVRNCAQKSLASCRHNPRIHPTAIVSEFARLDESVIVGPFSIIHPNVVIEEGVVIGSHCEIGYPAHKTGDASPLKVGKNSLIRSHSIFYEGSSFGENLVTGHRVTVREKTIAGRNLQIGTLTDIQGHCEIGDFVRFHSNVHIGQCSKIHDFVWIFPYVVLTNDPHPPSDIVLGATIERYVAIATMSVVLPGVKIQEGALVAAHSCVGKDVAPDSVVAGVPAKYLCNTDQIKMRDGSGRSAYPWRRHFHRGYFPDTVLSWTREFEPK